MVAYGIKCRHPYNYDDNSLENAIDVIQIDEAHEVGEIINDYWLIVNCETPWSNAPIFKYEKGEYVKAIDIRCFDVFATDKNYNDRKDLTLYGAESKLYFGNQVVVNVYGLI